MAAEMIGGPRLCEPLLATGAPTKEATIATPSPRAAVASARNPFGRSAARLCPAFRL